jgi:hypothetical protein
MINLRSIGQVFTDTAGKIYRVIVEAKVIVEEGTDKIRGTPPEIKSFSSSVEYVVDDSPVTIRWNVDHAPSVLLNGELVPKQGAKSFSLMNDQDFTLEARNEQLRNKDTGEPLSTSQKITVRVDKSPPAIISFQSNKLQATGGESIVLSWRVERATMMLIDGIGQVTGSSLTVTPKHDISYTLRAFSFSGRESEASIRVTVDKTPPNILSFEADRYFLTDKNPLIMSWAVTGAAKVEISGLGEVLPQVTQELFLRQDTQFELRATSFYGIVSSKEISIKVSKEPPVIRAFYAEKYILTDETPATLFWEVENADSLSIDHGIGNVTNLTEAKVHSMEDTVYTLQATSYFGVVSTVSLEIKISKEPPEITHFASDKEFILADFETTLTWETQNAHTVDISPSVGRVSSVGNHSLLIRKDTRFRLVATSYFGYKNQAEFTIRILPLPLMEQLLIPSIQVDATAQLEYTPIRTTQLNQPDININTLSFQNLDSSLLNIPDFSIHVNVPPPSLSGIREILDDSIEKLLKKNQTYSKSQDNEPH